MLIHVLESNGVEYFQANGDEIRIECPFCWHKNKKCYVNISKLLFDCKHCGESGSVKKLLESIGVDWNKVQLSMVQEKIRKSRDERSSIEKKLPLRSPLPKGFKRLRTGPGCDAGMNGIALNYLIAHRGWNLDDVEYTEAGVSSERECAGHIVFPVKDKDGAIIDYHTRRRFGTGPKNYSPSGSIHKEHFYNFHEAKHYDNLLIVEGIFDTIHCRRFFKNKIPFGCVASFGTSISVGQIALLAERKFKRIIFLLDDDAEENVFKAAIRLEKNTASQILVADVGTGDPDEHNFDELIASLDGACSAAVFRIMKQK